MGKGQRAELEAALSARIEAIFDRAPGLERARERDRGAGQVTRNDFPELVISHLPKNVVR